MKIIKMSTVHCALCNVPLDMTLICKDCVGENEMEATKKRLD